MNATSSAAVLRPQLVKLPPWVVSHEGVRFATSGSKWTFREGVARRSLNFSKIARLVSDDFLLTLKHVLVWYAQNLSGGYTSGALHRFQHFLQFLGRTRGCPISDVTAADILNYRATLLPMQHWYLGSLGMLLRRWHYMGFHGTESSLSALEEMSIPGSVKGEAVLTMDPLKGPLTTIELEGLRLAVEEARGSGRIADEDYLLTRLYLALGQRPCQYAALKLCDLHWDGPDENGEIQYTLNVPRAKQHGGTTRKSFTARPLTRDLGDALVEYGLAIAQRLKGRIDDVMQAPFFPARRNQEFAAGFEWHTTSTRLSTALMRALHSLNVKSERTGEPLRLFPLRLRRTLATRAAQEGYGERLIAELLDHSNTQNVGVYVAVVPELAARIDRAMAMELAPLAQAFRGQLIDKKEVAKQFLNQGSRIRDLRIDRNGAEMGTCGTESFCGLAAPIACYTCRSFRPWADGPHEAVLNFLLEKRKRIVGVGDVRQAEINDRTILAVAEVVQLCAGIAAKVNAHG